MRATHRVTHYRRASAGVSQLQEKLGEWVRLQRHIPCRIQGAQGTVRDDELGRESDASHWLFGESGWDVQPDDGFVVEDGPMEGVGFQATWRMDYGRVGGLQADLVESDEEFEAT